MSFLLFMVKWLYIAATTYESQSVENHHSMHSALPNKFMSLQN